LAGKHSKTIKPNPDVLHSDNGSPMKGASMLATLQALGVMPSFSRPSAKTMHFPNQCSKR
jgi:transposase InsO family protein